MTPKRPFIARSLPGVALLVMIWAVYWADAALNLHLYRFGIFPRTLSGLAGILLAPFIHGSMAHLFSNSLPLLILTTGIFYFYHKIAFDSFTWLWVSTGFWVWCMGRSSYHIGASGLIYAFAFFLFFMGLLRWERWSMAIALAVAFLYGGLLYGLSPDDPKISWESHMLGGLAGFLLAMAYRRKDLGKSPDPPPWKRREDLDSPLPFEGPYWMADENGIIPEHLVPDQEEPEKHEASQPLFKYHFVPKNREIND